MEDDSWQTFTSHFQVDLDSGKHTLLPDIPLKGEGSKASYLSTIIQLDSHSSSPEDKSTTPKKIRRLSQASDRKKISAILPWLLVLICYRQTQILKPGLIL